MPISKVFLPYKFQLNLTFLLYTWKTFKKRFRNKIKLPHLQTVTVRAIFALILKTELAYHCNDAVERKKKDIIITVLSGPLFKMPTVPKSNTGR